MTMQNLQIPETAESIIVPKWLFPPRFPDKDRFTSSRPDFVLVTPIAAKTQKLLILLGIKSRVRLCHSYSIWRLKF